jgi:Putative addiction module component
MLTLDQLISEATALPDAAKAILIDKIVESMTSQIDQDILMAGVKKAQERMAEIDSGAV